MPDPITMAALTSAAAGVLGTNAVKMLLEPGHVRRMAEANRHKALMEAKTEGEVALIREHNRIAVEKARLQGERALEEARALLLPPVTASEKALEGEVIDAEYEVTDDGPKLLARARDRQTFQEAKRQLNMENVVLQAAEEIGEQKKSDDKPVDPDFAARFFDGVKDVSNEEMQKIWAKLLAGEVLAPGRFSMRTLDVLRNMSMREAAYLKELTPFIVDHSVIFSHIFVKLSKYPHNNIIQLAEAGILSQNDGTLQFRWVVEAGETISASLSGVRIQGTAETAFTTDVAVYKLTQAGSELCRLDSLPANAEYVERIVAWYRGFKLIVETQQTPL